MVGVGGSDPMDFHALEALQCMVERRSGAETGIESVQLIEGDAVWSAGRDGLWSMDLLASALSRSDLLLGKTLEDARPQDRRGPYPGTALQTLRNAHPHLPERPAARRLERRLCAADEVERPVSIVVTRESG